MKFSKNDMAHFYIPLTVLFILGLVLRVFDAPELLQKSLYLSAALVLITVQGIYEYWQLHNIDEILKHGGLKEARQNSKQDWVALFIGIFLGTALFGVVLSV